MARPLLVLTSPWGGSHHGDLNPNTRAQDLGLPPIWSPLHPRSWGQLLKTNKMMIQLTNSLY